VVIDNILKKIKVDHLIDSETDIIVISNSTVGEDSIQRYIEEMCCRCVNTILIKNLTTTEVLKRMTYKLIKNSSFSPQDSHVQLFNKLSEITMGTVTLASIVTALFRKHNIDEISTIVDDCMKLLIIEKELCKNSTIMSLTCNALIKAIVSPEAQMLLNSLTVVGIYNIPIPSFIINEIEKLIISDSLLSESCFKELKDLSIIRNYPYPCIHENTDDVQCAELYYIPKLICNAMWEQNDEAEHLLNTLMLLKAIELNISDDTDDMIKLEFMFEILNIVYNNSDNEEILSKCMHLKAKITVYNNFNCSYNVLCIDILYCKII